MKHMDYQMRREAFERLQRGMSPEIIQLWHRARIQMGLETSLILLDETLRFAHRLEMRKMREENFGPVANPDGTPTELTKQMLEGTGRDPQEFVQRAGGRWTPIEDEHLEADYEDRHPEQQE